MIWSLDHEKTHKMSNSARKDFPTILLGMILALICLVAILVFLLAHYETVTVTSRIVSKYTKRSMIFSGKPPIAIWFTHYHFRLANGDNIKVSRQVYEHYRVGDSYQYTKVLR